MTDALFDSEQISAFLDEPETKGIRSQVYVRFYSDQYVKTVEQAMRLVYHFRTIPIALFQLGDVDALKVEVGSHSLNSMIFGFTPASGNVERDLAAIIDWFEKSKVAVELMPRVVTDWYPAQFSGPTFWKGLGVDSGWVPIVDDVCSQIQATLTADELQKFHWLQIKQENGGLTMFWSPTYHAVLDPLGPHTCLDYVSRQEIRWRFDGCDADLDLATVRRIQKIITNAQDRAASTCEHCGGAGTLRQHPSEDVLCDSCCSAWEQAIREDEVLQHEQFQSQRRD
jgi:hypothetical protein